MRPVFTAYDKAHSGLTKVEHFADCPLGEITLSSKVSNLKNLLVSLFGLRVIYALFVRVITMFYSIKGIFTTSAPSQVPKGAVASYAVQVPTLHSRWTGTNKGQQDEPMHPYGRMSFFTKQSYNGITKSHSWFKHFLGCADYKRATLTSLSVRAHCALVAHIVSRKIRDRFKNLWGYGRVLVSHRVALLYRVILWLEPGLLFTQRCLARSFIP